MVQNRVVRMLLWEMWARNRKLNTAAVLLAPLYLLYLRGNWLEQYREGNVIVYLLVHIVLILLLIFPGLFYVAYTLWVTGHAHEQTERQNAGFPARLLALPVSTATLVSVPLFTCIGLLVLQLLLFSVAVPQFFMDGHGWWIGLILLTGAVCIIAINWTLGWSRTLQIVTLAIVTTLLILGAVAPIERSGLSSMLRTGSIASVPILLVCGTVLAYCGVGAIRRGKFTGTWSVGDFVRTITDRLHGKPPLFYSSSDAQAWLERRSAFLFVPGVLIAHLGYILFTWLGSLLLDEPMSHNSIFATAFSPIALTLPLMALIVGDRMVRSGSLQGKYELGSLLASRPLTDCSLLLSKIRAGVLTLTLIFLLMTLIGGIYSALGTGWLADIIKIMTSATDIRQPATGIIMKSIRMFFITAFIPFLLITWMLLVGSIALLFRNSRTQGLLTGVGIGAILFAWMLVSTASHVQGIEIINVVMRVVTAVLLITLITLSLMATRKCIMRGLIKPAPLMIAGTATAVFSIVWFALRFDMPLGWSEFTIIGPAAMAVLPVTIVPVALLSLYHNRHA